MTDEITRQLLFIHGAGDNGEDPNGIVSYLQRELAGRYSLSRPQLPEPDTAVWGDEIERHLDGLAANSVIVGHSFGGSMLLKIIAERRAGLRAAGLVLLSPPWWGAEGWDHDSFALPSGFASELSGMGTIVHLHGRDDEVVDFAHQAIHAREMPAARYVALEGVTHDFSGAGQEAVLGAVRSL